MIPQTQEWLRDTTVNFLGQCSITAQQHHSIVYIGTNCLHFVTHKQVYNGKCVSVYINPEDFKFCELYIVHTSDFYCVMYVIKVTMFSVTLMKVNPID